MNFDVKLNHIFPEFMQTANAFVPLNNDAAGNEEAWEIKDDLMFTAPCARK